jgi:SAM-dependent methyltransferase
LTRPGLTAKTQQAIYDGRQDGYVPVYADAKFFKAYLRLQVERSRTTGRLGSSLKAVRNARELARLGLRPGQKLLDAGSGGGVFINQLLALYGVKGYGLDISGLALRRAKEAGSKAIQYKLGMLEAIPWPAGTFDAVVSFDVLEHVEGKAQALAEIVRVLKPGGRALVYAVSSRDVLTWHWWLRVLTLGRLGQDDEAGHAPELMASPFLTREQVEAVGGKVLRLAYLHSFFSLIFDEFLGKITIRRHAKMRAESGHGTAASPSLPGASGVYTLLRVLEPVLDLLEWPWKIFGLSNGFFILIEKPKIHAHP